MTRREAGAAAPTSRPTRRRAGRPHSAGFVDVGSLDGIAPRARYRRDLARLARALATTPTGHARVPFTIEVAAMSDAEIRRVNRRHLGHDWATDVVSFPLSARGASPLVGALAVSRDTARREAASRGHSPYDEWMLYVVHGTLHLLGHDDHAPAARARMRRAERAVLEAIGRPPVYGSEDEEARHS